jgi:type I restriction enzyme R subunit
MTTDTSEKGLEALIERSLILESGYEQSVQATYDRAYSVDKDKLFRFLEATQPVEFAQSGLGKGGVAEEKVLKRLSDQVRAKGIVEVLRKGIKDGETALKLYYSQPASNLNPEAIQKYEANIFSVARQVHFSVDNPKQSLDMVIFLNGLPLVTFELKNQFTNQNVKDAIRQYQQDRDPSEPLFAFSRCLVHFAVDDNVAFMTTELKGGATSFLPFNIGWSEGAGNPPNPAGLKTDYLWKRILTKESLSNIIEKYAQLVEEKGSDGKVKRKLIFPRFHQLDLVRKLLADARQHGAGQRYLIQHSAGSGKSNSISWLAHQLVELTDADNTSTVFDSVIVVTDRKVLDKQIRDNIKQFAHVKGVVEAITEGSKQLREALEEGKKVIVTTVQKFPFVVQEIQALGNKRFAILIDEAHSSQSGRAAAQMNVALAGTEDTGEEKDLEDRILEIIESQKLLKNASYFAFTATPKNRTLEAFGRKNQISGKFSPFHAYTMKQAIEEEFILDVLANYTTYSTFYKVLKTVSDDPQFDTTRAKKRLHKFVEGHEAAIRRKTEIMVDHFLGEVVGKKKINGRAKAMIVTSSIEAAVRYRLAFNAYLGELKSPWKAIVAFSGEKTVDGQKYDESKMNGFPSAEIPETFRKNEYRFLIVAEKFQTGFDEPLLHTMYVDKPLSDVKAVQTLSRLNRCLKPWKTDTFVLDFVNSSDQIKEAFDPFYRTTILSEQSDLNRLNDLQDALDAFQVYGRDQVEEVMVRFINGAPRDQLDPILDGCAAIFKDDLTLDKQIDFKTKAKSFVRAYQFLVMILPVKNVYWHSLNQFLHLLIPKLPEPAGGDDLTGLLKSVDMDSYRAEQEASIAIKLEGGGELDPTPVEVRGAGNDPVKDPLSLILADFNQKFGTDWTENDRIQRILFNELPDAVQRDQEYQNAKKNSDRQNARITYDKKLEDKFQEFMFEQTGLYRKFTDDPEFKKWLQDTLFRLDYDQGRAPSGASL